MNFLLKSNIKQTTNRTVRAAGRRLFRYIGAILCLSLLYNPAFAQKPYPSGPITFVVPSSPGSPSDAIARLIAKSFESQTGTAVVTEDRPGANGIIGVQHVRNARPDGQTVLFTTMSPMVLNKYLFKSLPYEPESDFIPVGVLARSTMFVALNPKQPFKTVDEIVDYAKSHPGKINYGYGTAVPQLAGSLFQKTTGAKVTFIPYKSHTAMVLALLSGELDMTITDTATLAPYIKRNEVRVLATTNPERLPAYPDIPTLKELGVNYELFAWHALYVRRGTAPEVIDRLAALLKTATQSPQLVKYLADSAIDNFLITGSEAENYVRKDSEKWKTIIHDAGITPN